MGRNRTFDRYIATFIPIIRIIQYTNQKIAGESFYEINEIKTAHNNVS